MGNSSVADQSQFGNSAGHRGLAGASRRRRGMPFQLGQHFHGLSAGSHDSDALWVATHRGLVRHINGAGWERVGPDNDYMGFAVHPTEPGVLYASGYPSPGSPTPNPVGLQVSRDGGLTWEGRFLVGQADFHAMTVSPADPQIIYGLNVMDGGLYRSQDGGQTWDNLDAPPFAIFSADGGSTWTPIMQHCRSVEPGQGP
jgi:hypothetical protein